MAQELIANSAVPGTEPPIGTLTAALVTAAAGSSGTIKTQAVSLAPLQVVGGQYRIRIDSELMLVTAGQNTTTHTVTRGIEGTTPTAHASNAPIYHELTIGALKNLAVSLAQLPAAVVRSDPKDLGAAKSGNVTLNLAEGRVFTLRTVTPGVTIQEPTNAVAGTPTYAEVWAFGAAAINFWAGLKWAGEKPETDLTSGLNVYMLVTLDGVNWWALAGGSIPADVMRVTGQKLGDTVEWDGGKWIAVAKSGLTKAETDARVKALALTGPPATIGNAPAADEVLMGLSSSTAQWESFISVLLELGGQLMLVPHEPLTANATLQVDGFYPVSTPGIKLATPEGELAVPRFFVVQNNSGGQIKVTGPFTPGSATVTTIELSPGTTWFYGYGSPAGWVRVSDSRTQAQLEAIITSLALTQNPDTAAGKWLGQSFDQSAASGSAQLLNEVIYWVKVMMPFTATIHEVVTAITTAGVGVTLGEVAIFDSTGKRVAAGKNNEAANFAKAELLQAKLTAATSLAGGPGVFYNVALLSVGGTPPFMAQSPYAGRLRDFNSQLTTSELRAAKARNAAKANTYATIPAELDPTSSLGKSSDVAPLFWTALA